VVFFSETWKKYHKSAGYYLQDFQKKRSGFS